MPRQWTVFGKSEQTGDTRLVVTGPESAAEALAEAKSARPDFKPVGEPVAGNVAEPKAAAPTKK